MRAVYQLTPSQTSVIVQLQTFRAASLFVANPTGSPVAVRVGGTDVPSVNSASHIVPAQGYLLVPVDGTTFAAGFTDAAAITAPATSGLQTTASLMLLDIDEPLPAFGSASFQSLSLSELTSGLQTFSGPVTSSVFDLGSWGGALVYVAPGASSGQGLIVVEAADSVSPASWSPVGTWAFWPGLPAIIQAPRTLRYLRVRLVATTIPGEATITGGYSVRGTIAEILDAGYTPFSSSFSKTFNIGAGIDGAFYIVTAGLPAISVGVTFTTGARSELISYAAPSPSGPWRTIAFREQSTTGITNGSIFRTYGSLDQYTELVISNLGVTSTTGTISFTIPVNQDMNGIQQSIYAALGDVAQTVNTRQSIYHELEAIYSIALNSIDGRLSTIVTDDNTRFLQLGSIDTRLVTINNNLTLNTNPALATIATNTSTTATNVATVNTTLGTTNFSLAQIVTRTGNIETNTSATASNVATVNTTLGTTNSTLSTIATNTGNTATNVATVNTTLGTTNTTLSSINTSAAAMAACLTRSVTPTGLAVNIVAPANWYSMGPFLVPGWYLSQFQASFGTGALGTNPTEILVATGTAGGAITVIYRTWSVTTNAGAWTGPSITLNSLRSAGYLIPAGHTTLWMQSTLVAGNASITITQGA